MSANQSNTVTLLALLCIAAPSHPATPITIDRTITYQTNQGFGATTAPAPIEQRGVSYGSAFVEQVIGDLGLTLIRDCIPLDFEPVNDNANPSDLSWSGFNLEGHMADRLEYIAALKRAAERHGRSFTFIAMVNSPRHG
ncbi:MAG: hypothetical protein GF331_16555 [Chitinivibrionales bacterium]|nr:hypothetical protein [Chitinivibrionales bacterium]